MKYMRRGMVAGIGTVALIAAFLFLQLTTPQSVGPLGVLAFFILVYITCACAVFVLLETAFVALKKYLPPGKLLLNIENTPKVKIYYYSSVLALAPVILLGMQSIGSVRLVDIGLLTAFEALACFYISRRF